MGAAPLACSHGYKLAPDGTVSPNCVECRKHFVKRLDVELMIQQQAREAAISKVVLPIALLHPQSRLVRIFESGAGDTLVVAPIAVFEGRYGLFVTDGEVSAGVKAPDLHTLTLEAALSLLDNRRDVLAVGATAKFMTAHPGVCLVCGEAYEPGAWIFWRKPLGCWHMECGGYVTERYGAPVVVRDVEPCVRCVGPRRRGYCAMCQMLFEICDCSPMNPHEGCEPAEGER